MDEETVNKMIMRMRVCYGNHWDGMDDCKKCPLRAGCEAEFEHG